MMNMNLTLLGGALFALTAICDPAIGSPTPADENFSVSFRVPTPQQLYVSCSLLAADEDLKAPVKGPPDKGVVSQFAPLVCAAMLHGMDSPEPHIVTGDRDYCLPKGPARPDYATQARAYVEFFDNNAPRLKAVTGELALAWAFHARWSCR